MHTDLNGYVTHIEEEYLKAIEEIKHRGKIRKIEFFAADLKLAKDAAYRKRRPDPTFFTTISRYYYDLCFEADKAVKDRFIFWGIPETALKWMIPLDDILKSIKAIEIDNNALFLKNVALQIIQCHIEIKTKFEIFSWADTATRKKHRELSQHKYFHNFFRRFDEGHGKFKRKSNRFEILMESLLQEIAKIAKDKKEKRALFIDQLKGESRISLEILPALFFNEPEISESKRLLALFDILNLICKDKHWLTELEFDRIKARKNVEDKSFYDGTYNIYLINSIKKYLYKT
ncbi:hypothetical protein [Terrimonas pollutisoli]|uniref:hypothetical protein n=1 Tax=Terrimonas pollutisoli TaxID=3034147 RepID=UPI0023EDE118|nr:hypothetical protein [Terrimonas sp. H1YJ31]